MTPLAISALGVVSALGLGRAAHLAALRARRGGLRPNDFDLAIGGWIGRVAGVEDHPLAPALVRFDCRNNRLADLALGTDGFADAVAAARARYGPGRIGVVVGTSTSGILSAEAAWGMAPPDRLPDAFDFAGTQDLASLGRFVAAALRLDGPVAVVSTACASSARCFADAAGMIAAGVCDAVVVGGADSLCRMTLHGFAALELIAAGPTRPCDAARDGISIGEAAGFALLERDPTGAGTGVALLGGGASSDAHHMSQPHPEGAGAVRAMRAALASAGLAPEAIDWINLHGTGTPANDAMEDRAVFAVFGDAVAASSTKGWTGHTLGACGILEAALAVACIGAGLLPGCLGVAAPDPAFRARIAVANADRPIRRVLSNAFGFGGINCSLVFGAA